jgi:hypothetical protein
MKAVENWLTSAGSNGNIKEFLNRYAKTNLFQKSFKEGDLQNATYTATV